MIRVERQAKPAALEKTYASGRNQGKSELEVVLGELAKHLEAGEPATTFTFDYKRYKDAEVKRALDATFAGKCAYCETYYSASQPMDVEHWRPKGEVHLDDDTVLKPGYYWLAANWDNLFPSCIDCNRARQQHDLFEQKTILLGKANQFPLTDEAARIRGHDPQPDLTAEGGSLINPCEEDPERFFAYTEEGVMVPRDGLSAADRERARVSIRVYALNRSALVAERFEVIQRIHHRLRLIDALADLRARLEAETLPDLAEIVAELIRTEATALEAMTDAGSPFAGAARFVLSAGDR